MNSSVNGARRPMPVQPLDKQSTLPLKTLVKGPEKVQNSDGDWILPVIDAAIEQAYPGQRANAAREMGMDPSYLNRLIRDADGHLSVRKMGLMGEPFWGALIDQLRKKFGMESDEERLRRALDARAACDRVIEEIARKGLR